MRYVLIAIAGLALGLPPILSSEAAGNSQAGRDLAQQWCSSCHVIGPSERGQDAAPSFPAIARRTPSDHEALRAWLTAPHPPMPNLSLSRQQIDDVVAYIDSLAPH
jgi:cytochrome c